MQVTAHELVLMMAIAIALGMLAQVIAHKARLLSNTRAFGRGLEAIVTIAVAKGAEERLRKRLGSGIPTLSETPA